MDEVIAKEEEEEEKDNDEGHHTIPIYLCGAMNQVLSQLPHSDHVQVHRDIAPITLAYKEAADFADVALGRRRKKEVLSLADTEAGRS